MAEPMVHHRGRRFPASSTSAASRGSRTSSAPKSQVLLFSASGTGAMDSAVANLCAAGDRVAVVTAGAFGERWVAICEHYGLDVQRIAYEWGEVPVPARSARRSPRAARGVVFCTQSETSTGVVSDVQALKAAVGDADARRRRDLLARRRAARDRRLGDRRRPLRLAEGADVPARPRDGERGGGALGRLPPSRSFYFDWRATRKAQEVFDAAFTPAVSLIRGLDVALGLLLERRPRGGVRAARAARPRGARRAQGDGARALLARRRLVRGGHRRERAPTGSTAPSCSRHLRDRHGVTLAPGQGRLKGKIFRIGHIGWFDVFDIAAALAAVELSLTELGADIERGVAVRARSRRTSSYGSGWKPKCRGSRCGPSPWSGSRRSCGRRR